MYVKFTVSWILLLMVVITVTQAVIPAFNVTVFNKRLVSRNYSTLYNLSYPQCQAACRLRTRCQSINYERRFEMCQLNLYTPSTTYTLQARLGAVHHVLKDVSAGDNENTMQCGSTSCSTYETCNSVTEQCYVTECEDLKTPINGNMAGNVGSVGGKALLGCNHCTYIPASITLPFQTNCQQNSTWSLNNLHCRDAIHVCDGYLVSPDATGAFDRLTSSGDYEAAMAAAQGFLNNPSSSWGAIANNEDQYLQAEFTSVQFVGGVATQGYTDASYNEYVTSYSVAYSLNCTTFNDVVDEHGSVIIFEGNTDYSTVVENKFCAVQAMCNYFPRTRGQRSGCDVAEESALHCKYQQ